MFNWQTSDALALQDTDPKPLAEAALLDASAAPDADWDERGYNQPAGNEDFTRHSLLTAEQEADLASRFQRAFDQLKELLLQDKQPLTQLVDHVAAERWRECNGSDARMARRCNLIISRHDKWQLLTHLASRAPLWHAKAEQQLNKLVRSLRRLPFERDLLLQTAESIKQPSSRLANQLRQLYLIRNEFITHNIRLVYFVARRYQDRGVELDDLVQEGILGLLRAAFKFDPGAARFSTYAYWWIWQAIHQALSRQQSLIRYPNNILLQMNQLHGFRQHYHNRTGLWPSKAQIQAHTGLAADTIDDLLSLSNFCISADEPVHPDDAVTLVEVLAANDSIPTPEQQLDKADQARQVERFLNSLPAREALILKLKFGIGQRKEYSLQEIAPQLDLTGERVRQLEKQALARLQKLLFRSPYI